MGQSCTKHSEALSPSVFIQGFAAHLRRPGRIPVLFPSFSDFHPKAASNSIEFLSSCETFFFGFLALLLSFQINSLSRASIESIHGVKVDCYEALSVHTRIGLSEQSYEVSETK